MSKAIYQVKVKDKEKILEGTLFVYGKAETVVHKVGDPIMVVNPYTKLPEECKVYEVGPSEDPKTGDKGIAVKFKALD